MKTLHCLLPCDGYLIDNDGRRITEGDLWHLHDGFIEIEAENTAEDMTRALEELLEEGRDDLTMANAYLRFPWDNGDLCKYVQGQEIDRKSGDLAVVKFRVQFYKIEL